MDVRGVSFEVRFEFKALCNCYEFYFHVYVITILCQQTGNSKKLNTDNLWSEITDLDLKSGYQNCVRNMGKLKKSLKL